MYKIKRLCFDSNLGVPPYEDNPIEIFNNLEYAWNFALELAEQETEYLNSDCDEGISFGIPKDKEYEDKMLCKVNYYYNPDGDETGNTEIVTQYLVYFDDIIAKYNKLLRDKHGENITVRLESYKDDDDTIKYYYTSKYGQSDIYHTIEEAHKNADIYLQGVGELW